MEELQLRELLNILRRNDSDFLAAVFTYAVLLERAINEKEP